MRVLACVMNVSEGRSSRVLDALAAACGPSLLDLHADPHHHRAVLWILGEDAARAVAEEAVARIDLRRHAGVHPRLGAVDVAPFVAIDGSAVGDQALAARSRFAGWIADELGVPAFLYGPERALPDIRRGAFVTLAPEAGPLLPHPTAGATAVGARPSLVAYNVWLTTADLPVVRRIARSLRGPAVRALGLRVGDRVQVSMNLLSPLEVGPAQVYDTIALEAPVLKAELVGLVPRAVLEATPPARWTELDLAPDRTVEYRVEEAGQRRAR